MDAMPPSPPPALVRASNQDAVDAVQRIIELEGWLIRQQASMPALPESFDNVSLAGFVADIEAWWSVSPSDTATSTRRSALARRLASAMGDLAMLRGFDGSLDDRARRLAMAVANTRGGPLPDVELREVTFGDTVHAGTLMVLDTRESGTVLAFTSTRGWDHYADIAEAHAAIEGQARRLLTWRSDLPGLSRDTVEAAADLPAIGSRVIPGAPFDTLVDGLVAAQRSKIEQAWVEFELEKHFPSRERRLADRLRDAMRLSEVVDVEAILRVRDARLRRAVEEDRLASVPDALAKAWRAARDAYVDTLRAVSARQEDAALAAPTELEEFTTDQLRRVLRQVGIQDDPRDIRLTLDRSYDPASRLESVASFFGGPASIHLPLLDAAYRNVPAIGGGIFTARGVAGTVLDALNDKGLRLLLNRLDVHTMYRQRLHSELREGEQGALRKELFAEERSARMRRDAVDARVSNHRGEWADRQHLGLGDASWHRVIALLDATAASPVGDRKDMVVSQVALNDIPLRDVVEIAAPSTAAARPLIYYTPDAPDGAMFREFRDREEADVRFFHHPWFRSYLLERLPLATAAALRDAPAGALNANRSVRWVFGGTQGGDTQPVRVTSRVIAGDLFEALYETAVDHSLLNAQEVTRSPADANRELLNDLWRRNPANAAPAQVAIAAVTAPFRVAPALWRAYDAVRSGDYADAFVEASEGYVVALAAYSLATPVLHGAASPYLVNFRTIGGALASRPMRRPAHVFDPRHLAEGIVRKGAPDAHGVYRIDGKPYAAVEDKLYRLEYESFVGSVRLGPVIDAGVPGPAIRLSQGRWQPERHGWVRSGRTTSAELADRLPGFYSEYANHLEQAFPDAIERQLVSDQMFREIRGQPTRRIVTQGQRERFQQAVARAEEVIRASYNIVPSLPGNLRRVSPEALPEYLWFYDEKPVRQSAFFAATRRGEAWGALRTEVQARNIIGARLTSVPPEAATPVIAAGSGLRLLDRTKAFAVQVRVRDLLRAQPAGKAPLELLNVVAGRGDRYVLQTAPGRPLMLEPGQFRIVDELPPSPPP
jgi:hypothetical protein